MARSRLRPAKQISSSKNFDDNKNLSTRDNAETTAISLDDDLNVLRTLLREAKGTANWYDQPSSTLSQLKSAVDANTSNLTSSDDSITALQSGAGITDSTIDYSSNNIITDNQTLKSAIETLDDGYNGLQQDILNLNLQDVYDQGSSGLIKLSSGKSFSIKDDNSTRSYFTVDPTTDNVELSDGNTSKFENKYLLSHSASDFSSALYASAGRIKGSQHLGIIDAINIAYGTGGGSSSVEKAVYIIQASDNRVISGDYLNANILSLNLTGSGPNRGSLELTGQDGYGTNFRPGRDFEVYLNGQLLLQDQVQSTNGAAPTDEYFLASDDLDKLNFAFDLTEGDIITIRNTKVAPGEDVDSGWALIQ